VSVATVAIDTNDISNVHCYCAFAGLVPPRSLKLKLRYLKTETYGVFLNLVTRPRARMRERSRGFENGVCVLAGTTRVVRKTVHVCRR
jgi:hypothetical protein